MIASGHIAILLSAAVALCPLHCLLVCHSHADYSLASDLRSAMLADEDDHQHQQDGPADRQEPCQEHQHVDCVCQGALPVQYFVLDDDCAVDWVWQLATQAGAAEQYLVLSEASSRVSASFFWPELKSGHGLCALISCWRI